MACVEKLWDIGFRTPSSASLAADMALRKIWNFGKRIIVCWWPEYHGMAVDNIWDCYLLRGRCCSDQGMAVDPPERDERERRPREERAIGSARCDLLQCNVQRPFMYFILHIIHITHTSHLYICTSSVWYTYISGTGGSSRFPSGLVSSSTGTGSSVQARWFCHLTRLVKE